MILKRGLAVWYKKGTTTVWFEAGKRWAAGLVSGSFLSELGRLIVLNLIAPGLGTAMSFVIMWYRGKLKKHVGPNEIWVAVRPMHPAIPKPPLAYAKKRNKENMLKPPDPWEPPGSNLL